MSTFTCGLRISCAIGRCQFVACANPDHAEFRGDDPHAVMEQHRADAHGVVGQEGEQSNG